MTSTPSRPDTEISIAVPMHNEEESIREFFGRLVPILNQLDLTWEIVCIDDGSTDRTWARLREGQSEHSSVQLIRLSRNFGKEIALTAGLDHASGSAIILIDADLQDPPELISEFVKHWRQGYQNVYGVRTDRSQDTLFKRYTAGWFYRVFNLVSINRIPPHGGDFRLLGPDVVDALRSCREKNRFMKGLYSWVGVPSVAVPYERPERLVGKSSFNLRRLWRLAMDGLVSHSTALLKIWTYIGIAAMFVAVGLGIWLLGEYLLVRRNPPGFYLTIMVVLGLQSLNFVMLGIVGEYIGRIYDEVKQRPLYIERNDDLAE